MKGKHLLVIICFFISLSIPFAFWYYGMDYFARDVQIILIGLFGYYLSANLNSDYFIYTFCTMVISIIQTFIYGAHFSLENVLYVFLYYIFAIPTVFSIIIATRYLDRRE